MFRYGMLLAMDQYAAIILGALAASIMTGLSTIWYMKGSYEAGEKATDNELRKISDSIRDLRTTVGQQGAAMSERMRGVEASIREVERSVYGVVGRVVALETINRLEEKGRPGCDE